MPPIDQNLWSKLREQIHWRFVFKASAIGIALVVLVYSILYLIADRENHGMQAERQGQLKQIADALASLASDADQDGILEPPSPTDSQGNYGAQPQEIIPPSLGISQKNAGGRFYRYCAWDYGSKVNMSRYWTALDSSRRPVALEYPAPSKIALAVIDAGRNQQFDTPCLAVTTPNQSFGDDLTVTLDVHSLSEFSQKTKQVARQNLVTCAFGEIYTWDNNRQNWLCAKPKPELATTMPAGCPKGQVLVERSTKIKCENLESVVGKSEEDGKVSNAAIAVDTNTTTPLGVVDARPLPSASEPTPGNVALPQPAQAEPAGRVTTLGPTGNTQIDVNSSNPNNAIAANPGTTATPVGQNLLNESNSKATSSPNGASVRGGNLLGEDTYNSAPRGINLLPGENMQADFNQTTVSSSIPRGDNLLRAADSQDSNNRPETGIEREIKKSNRPAKFRSCNPWLYLKRSVGEVTQCVRPISYGNSFGVTAGMTSWPGAFGFLRSAFMFCPTLPNGATGICLAMRFAMDSTAADVAQIWKTGGYICARVVNPLPPPWPQFESVLVRERIDPLRLGACRVDQLPVLEKIGNGAQRQLLCFNLNDKLSQLDNDGYCGCGWSLIWNASSGRFECS
jgi:hypothetical protein